IRLALQRSGVSRKVVWGRRVILGFGDPRHLLHRLRLPRRTLLAPGHTRPHPETEAAPGFPPDPDRPHLRPPLGPESPPRRPPSPSHRGREARPHRVHGVAINSSGGLPVFRRCMTRIASIAPTFAVRGNWDVWYWSDLDLFGGTGVRELNGEAVAVQVRGT